MKLSEKKKIRTDVSEKYSKALQLSRVGAFLWLPTT